MITPTDTLQNMRERETATTQHGPGELHILQTRRHLCLFRTAASLTYESTKALYAPNGKVQRTPIFQHPRSHNNTSQSKKKTPKKEDTITTAARGATGEHRKPGQPTPKDNNHIKSTRKQISRRRVRVRRAFQKNKNKNITC